VFAVVALVAGRAFAGLAGLAVARFDRCLGADAGDVPLELRAPVTRAVAEAGEACAEPADRAEREKTHEGSTQESISHHHALL
jgi:hypothetical protein